MKRILATFLVMVMLVAGARVATAGLEEPTYVIDSPTAGLLAHGEYLLQSRVGPNSSLLSSVQLGIRDILQLGVAFGVQGVFERADVSVNDQVGFLVRVRLLQESIAPALAVGFDSQGVGLYDETLNRYERKSKGFYAVLSKNWKLLVGQASLHGGINYSLERDDEESVDGFGGVDWEVMQGLSFLADLDLALDDSNEDGMYGRGGVYLDAAVRVRYGENLSLMIIFRDLTGNFEPNRRVGRELEIAYVDLF